MNPLAFDTETALIRPALLAPPLVCVSWQRPGFEAKLDSHLDARARLRGWLQDPTTLLVGHFVAYDMTVICAEFPDLVPLVFRAYREGRVTCTKKRQQLLDIAGGVFRGRATEKGFWITHEYTLEALASRLLGRKMLKDGWRLQYANFRDVPIAQWVEHARSLQASGRVRRAELAALVPADGSFKYEFEEFERVHGDEIRNLEVMLADVPEGCIRYPKEDAECTLGVFLAQEKHAEPYLRDQFRQSYADFVLYLSSAWGLRTHGPGVESLKAELEEAHREIEGELQALGMVREDGTRNMRVVKDAMIAACKEYGLPLRRTEAHEKCEGPQCQKCEGVGFYGVPNEWQPGTQRDQSCEVCGGKGRLPADECTDHVSLDSDACEAVTLAAGEGDDNPLHAYAEFTALTKMLSNDVKMLESGTVYPVHTRYDLAETGRTTSSKPNIQNLNTGRIKNKNSTAQRLRKGVRQAFVPRPGKVFAQADFPQLELYTLAQCCYSWLGFSGLGDALNAGLDPHLSVAAKIVGCSYEEALARKKEPAVDHARQIGKVFNFGKPGGLGAAKLIMFARKTYGVELTREQVEAYTVQWHEAFPEMRQYFARVNAMFGDDVERASIETLFTERWRGGATYCACCNNGFQALGVDCAKAALCLVAEAEYVNTASSLFGSRTVAFVHDEIIVETDDTSGAHDGAIELARLMVDGANRYLPNVPIQMSKMEPTLMRAWSKDAKQVWDEKGRLCPWAP